jgi:hypothetical protein
MVAAANRAGLTSNGGARMKGDELRVADPFQG